MFAVIGVALVVDASRIVVSLRTARLYHSAALRSNAFHFAGDLAGSLAVLAGLIARGGGLNRPATRSPRSWWPAIIFGGGRAADLRERARADGHRAGRRAGAGRARHPRARRRRRAAAAAAARVRRAHTSPTRSSACRRGRRSSRGTSTADAVEAAVRDALPDSDVVVHLEPRREGLDLRDRALAAALAEPLVREAHDITIYEHDGRMSVSLHLKMAPDIALADGARGRRAGRGGAARGAGCRRRAHAPRAAGAAAGRAPRRGPRAPRRRRARADHRAGDRAHRPAAARAAAAARRRRPGRVRLGGASRPTSRCPTRTSSRAGWRTTSARASRTCRTSSSTPSPNVAGAARS